MERMKWFIFVAVLVFLTACSTEQVTDETADRLETLEQEYELLKADLDVLRDQNVALVITNEEFRTANDTLRQNYMQLTEEYNELYRTVNSLEETVAWVEDFDVDAGVLLVPTEPDYTDIYNAINKNSMDIHMTDYNIRTLFQVTEVDKYHYMDYQVGEQMGYADDLSELMGYYSYYLDGANAEGFSSLLADVYHKMTLEDYLDEVSLYNSKVIKSLSSLLAYGLGIPGTEEILEDLEGLDASYKEMEAYKELKEAAEIMW